MIRKILEIILFFYLLVIFQVSFLPHFQLNDQIFNLILISIIFLNLFLKTENYFGIYAAFWGGFFLDIFSQNPFGFYVFISVSLAVFLKFVVRKYLRIPAFY